MLQKVMQAMMPTEKMIEMFTYKITSNSQSNKLQKKCL